MTGSEPQVQFDEVDGVHVIQIIRSLVDRVSVKRVSELIGARLETTTAPKVVICFDRIEEVSSAILGALLKIDKQVRVKQGRLHLAGMQPSVHEVFQLTRLDTVLAIYDTTAAAIRDFD